MESGSILHDEDIRALAPEMSLSQFRIDDFEEFQPLKQFSKLNYAIWGLDVMVLVSITGTTYLCYCSNGQYYNQIGGCPGQMTTTIPVGK
ncbi:unnamed protein product, partial [Mesorhabditis belari]|uniref:Uncharacterized protein n=1 Tax=Mesorhabditis belari TaxID=2138241 RepID=A0AAF3ECC3_9BILA